MAAEAARSNRPRSQTKRPLRIQRRGANFRRGTTPVRSRSGRYYRAHPDRERGRKLAESARWRSSLQGFKDVNPGVERLTLREFRVLARQRGWLPPNHSGKHRASKAIADARRRFVEEGLNRHYDPDSYAILYPV